MKKLTLKLACFLPVLLLVAGINYWVDPSQLFGNGRIERRVAAALTAGQNVSNLINYDHRLLQKFYFASLREPIEVVVIGSSRIMVLGQAQFTGRSLYNASVAGASVEDYIAIYQVMLEKDALPRMLILEVSPWVFNRDNGQTRWKTLRAEYLRGLRRLNIPAGWQTLLSSFDIQKYAALPSLPYLQESLRWLSHPDEPVVTDESYTGQVMKMSDGTRVYDADSIARNVEDVEALVENALVAPYGLTEYGGLDTDLIEMFERFVVQVQADGVQVVIFLSPFQPTYYNTLVASDQYPLMIDAEVYLQNFAEEHSIPIVGSYDPAVFECGPAEFYDGIHMRPECLAKIDLSGLQTAIRP